MRDAVYLLCGPCTFQFGECIIVFHVLNLTYIKGCFHNAADFLDMEAGVRRSKLLLCGKVMGIAFNGGIATHSTGIFLTCRLLVGAVVAIAVAVALAITIVAVVVVVVVVVVIV